MLPGILLRLGYFRGFDLDDAWKTASTIQSLGDVIAESSLFAGALHILWVLGWSHFKRPVNLANALTLLVAPTGNNGGDLVKTAIQETAHPERWFQWRPRWWPDGSKKHADLVQISAVIKQGSDIYIYTGSLVDYIFDRTGQLDRLVLSETSRRLPSKDKRSLGKQPQRGQP